MHVIDVPNVRNALPEGLRHLAHEGELRYSRNGDVIVSPTPVMTIYSYPMDCVMLNPLRNANPFFHLAEAVWMLNGQNDTAFLDYYVSDFGRRFGELDGTLHGAYGQRWRDVNGFDQLEHIIEVLRRDPGTRQIVLQMWDAFIEQDLTGDWRDRPCNTHVYFRMRNGKLDMTVCCRSNDILMGAYGANAVHFAFLHQYVAGMLRCTSGNYYQFSNDFHAYVSDLVALQRRVGLKAPLIDQTANSPAILGDLIHLASLVTDNRQPFSFLTSLVRDPETFDDDLSRLIDNIQELHASPYVKSAKLPELQWVTRNQYLIRTILQALYAHHVYKLGNAQEALKLALEIDAPDWKIACAEWINRHMKKDSEWLERHLKG